ncbi:MAG: filamentous hemagglutinin N-terminal domain-containing protein [Chlamydiota bacterium]
MLKLRVFYSLIMFTASTSLFSLPDGFQLVSGTAELFSPDLSTIEIKMGKEAVIHWDSFCIEKMETTRFMMHDAHSVVFNHVTGGTLSKILGKLEANGHVYLMSPKGILIGKEACINTASFIASGFEIINQGRIIAKSGDVILKGTHVSHAGSIEALKTEKSQGRIILLADKGKLDCLGSVTAHEGEIQLLGEVIKLSEKACIDVSAQNSGGSVFIGGGFQGKDPSISNAKSCFIDEHVNILAHAELNGNGGRVIIWSDESTSFAGYINVRGGECSGNGGFAEVSSKGDYFYEGFTDARAPYGASGTLLMDPTDVTIIASVGSGTLTFGGPCGANNFCGNGALSGTVSDTQIITALGGGNVIVDAAQGSGAGSGSIIANSGVNISWANNNSLTLNASGPITLTGTNILCTGNGDISLIAIGTITLEQGTAVESQGSGLITVTTQQDLNLLGGMLPGEFAVILTDQGDATFTIGGNLNLQGGTQFNTYASIGSRSSNAGSSLLFNSVGGDVTLTATNDLGYALIGHIFSTVAIGVVQKGDITFSSVGGNFSLNGNNSGGPNVQFAQVGHAGAQLGGTYTAQGTISLANVAGTLTLQDEAVIGLGNSFNVGTLTLSSDIFIVADEIDLNATIGNAIIGFDYTTGSIGSISSNTLSVTGNNGININSAAGKAVIGAFPDNMGGSDTILINQLTAATGGTANILITSTSAQNALLGCLSINATPVTCNITINNTEKVQLQGSSTSTGNALIANVNSTPLTSNGTTITFDPQTNIILNGGGLGATAAILSQGTISIAVTDGLELNNLDNQDGEALIQAFGDILINTSSSLQPIITLGTGLNAASSTIEALGGNVAIGTSSFFGASDITIGNSTMLGDAVITSAAGSVSMNISGDYTLIGGSSLFSSRAAILTAAGIIHLQGTNYSLFGGPGLGADEAAIQSGLGGGSITILSQGILSLQGNADQKAFIQTLGATGNQSINITTVDMTITGVSGNSGLETTSGNIQILCGTTGISGSCTLQGASIEANFGNLNITAGLNIGLTDSSFLTTPASLAGQLIVLAGTDMVIDATSVVEIQGNGSLVLVVDNANNTSPNFSPTASFTLSSGSTIGVMGFGNVRIYTARRNQNGVPNGSTINSAVYMMEFPEGNTTDQEAWNVYYPSILPPAVGVPFSIYYKLVDGSPPPPPPPPPAPEKLSKGEIAFIRYETAIATSELFFDLSLYDSFRFANWDYINYFEEGSFAVVVERKGKAVDGRYLFMHPRHSFNKFIPYDFSVPDSFSSIAAAVEKGPEVQGERYIPLPVPQPATNVIDDHVLIEKKEEAKSVEAKEDPESSQEEPPPT